ncbi:unnamed protein product [Linum trigynum]|uniref:SUI1 domain-containing protein n=1 Tax=Linum trigynum TaxID=586398 RepID=A0AAV2D9B0_9ROSI
MPPSTAPSSTASGRGVYCGSCVSDFEGGTSDFPTLWQKNLKQCEFCTAAYALFRRSTVNLDPILRSATPSSSGTPPTTDVYLDLLKDANEKDIDKVSDCLQPIGISLEGSSDGAASSTQSASKAEEVKRLPGGKIKKKEKQEVVIDKVVRNKRKCITIIKGLELYGIKLSVASKKLEKKFATGASVVKGPTDKEQIDVQGDIGYDVVEFIRHVA